LNYVDCVELCNVVGARGSGPGELRPCCSGKGAHEHEAKYSFPRFRIASSFLRSGVSIEAKILFLEDGLAN
jgi:hypothetical protein